MALPKQVQEQVERADALQKQLYGDAEPMDPNAPIVEVVEPQAKQEAKSLPEIPEIVEQTAPEEPAPETPPKSETDESDAAVWKQKYKTLQGMYDAEVPRLHAQNKELTGQINEMGEKLDTLVKSQAEEQQKAAVKTQQNLITDEDRQEFGDELIEVQRKVAREETAELIAKFEALAAENAELKQQLDRTGAQVVTASFEQRLAQLVPDFAEINVSPQWIAWLDEVDPMLRGPRMAAAQDAYAQGDADGVAHFVRLFKESTQPVETPEPVTNTELESQIQPSTAATATPPTSTAKGNVLTDVDIRQMFNKVMQLNAAGRAEEARKLEAEIDAAYQQGRVVS